MHPFESIITVMLASIGGAIFAASKLQSQNRPPQLEPELTSLMDIASQKTCAAAADHHELHVLHLLLAIMAIQAALVLWATLRIIFVAKLAEIRTILLQVLNEIYVRPFVELHGIAALATNNVINRILAIGVTDLIRVTLQRTYLLVRSNQHGNKDAREELEPLEEATIAENVAKTIESDQGWDMLPEAAQTSETKILAWSMATSCASLDD